MSQEQLKLIAQILDDILNHGPFEAPYMTFGANVGQCIFCGAIGEVRYPEIVYSHKGTCAIALNAQLQQSLQSEEGGTQP